MTDEQVRNGFNEVHNVFWKKYKNHVPSKDSEEWDHITAWSSELQNKYPFLKETIIELTIELDQRMRRGDKDGSIPGSVKG